ncbi:AlbA family DNA-binding domain-containing protein [Saccharibacillus sacchari]|uniref:AlbA family DNA-binding domain-containing protein n=1 Tax=Saccharibacillus sacchari TaxID=456493 RepID=UPI0004B9A23E|nr:ATP-binding protein [Saccharibacillus sacchari]
MNELDDLILYGHEGECLDYKQTQYSPDKTIDFIKDVIAMANVISDEDKYIIIGIKDRKEGKDFIGITPEEFRDSAEYAVILSSYVEPDIAFEYFKYELKGKAYGIFKIFGNTDRPYVVKKNKAIFHKEGEATSQKKATYLQVGDSWIRKGSHNSRLQRRDLDLIYEGKEQVEVAFRNDLLFARVERLGCASIEVRISNYTKKPVTIIAGSLTVFDLEGNKLSRHMVCGMKEDVGGDFQISLLPAHETVGELFVRFESSDPIRLNLDEYGTTDREFKFKLTLYDAKEIEYIAMITGDVIARGDILEKLQRWKKQ